MSVAPFGGGCALALHHVRPVDAGGRDLHQHFAGLGCGTALFRRRHTSGPPGSRMAMAVMGAGMIISDPRTDPR